MARCFGWRAAYHVVILLPFTGKGADMIRVPLLLLMAASGGLRQEWQPVDKGVPVREPLNSGGVKYSLNDGPHLLWRDDTTAVVFYYWRGSLESSTMSATLQLTFDGFAWDSTETYSVSTTAPQRQPLEFEGVERLLAVSDIHGDHGSLRGILRAAGVIDEQDRWTWGDGHLVVLGDVLDRGGGVTECLWLIYRLRQEAAGQGGRVHCLLGNHELMVIRGDLRYVHERYLEGVAGATGMEYDDLFGPGTELGRWMRTWPAAVIVDGTLFVHGGIAPPSVTDALPLEEMNELAWRALDISSVMLRFSPDEAVLFGGLGPFWYRGYHYGMEDRYPQASSDDIEGLLEYYGVDRMVVGHSEVDGITPLYGGRVIAIDVPVEELGGQQALLFKDGMLYAVDHEGVLRELP